MVDYRLALVITVFVGLAGFAAGFLSRGEYIAVPATVTTTVTATVATTVAAASPVAQPGLGTYAIYSSSSDDYLLIVVVSANSTHIVLKYAGWVSFKEYPGTLIVRRGEPILPLASRPVFRNEETEYVEGWGTRTCLIYVSKTYTEDITIYIDKETMWPIKIVLSGWSSAVSLRLVETNLRKI